MRYKARWTDGPERRLYNGANGVVEDIGLVEKNTVCFTHNLAMAERIAAALDVVLRYKDNELKAFASNLED